MHHISLLMLYKTLAKYPLLLNVIFRTLNFLKCMNIMLLLKVVYKNVDITSAFLLNLH